MLSNSEVEALKSAFSHNNDLAGWSTRVVFAGLIVEYSLLLWLKWKELSRLERVLTVICGIAVTGGVYGEYFFGANTTQAAIQLQNDSDAHVAEANQRAAIAENNTEKLRAENRKEERLLTGRVFVLEGDWQKLSHFRGTQVWIQTIGSESPFIPGTPEYESDSKSRKEAAWFSGSFMFMPYGWKPAIRIPEPIVAGVGLEGLHIYSYSNGPQPNGPWTDPYTMPLNTPEDKGWAAAEALTRYLQSELGLSSIVHWDFAPMAMAGMDEFKGLPRDAVVIQIGRYDPIGELKRLREQHDLEDRVPWRSP